MLLRILRLRLVLVQAFRLAGVVCSYLPFVFVLCFTTLGYAALVSLNTTHATVLRRVSGLFTSTLLYVLTVWSFMACVFSDPGSPMTWYNQHSGHLQEEGFSMLVKGDGKRRYCKKCHFVKPDRTHHCSTCGRCILKMDHHCLWLATCIGHGNHRYFIQFLVYVSLLCVWGFVANLYSVIDFITGEDMENEMISISYLLTCIFSLIFGIPMIGFAAFHLYLVARNMTTIEALEKSRYNIRQRGENRFATAADRLQHVVRNTRRWRLRDGGYSEVSGHDEGHHEDADDRKTFGNAFDVGVRENWKQVMGTRPLRWFVPLGAPSSDGWSWPINERARAAVLHNIELQRQNKLQETSQDSTPPAQYYVDRALQRVDVATSRDDSDEAFA